MPTISPPNEEQGALTTGPSTSLLGFRRAEDHLVKADQRVVAVTPEFLEGDFRRRRLHELLFREKIYFWFCLIVSTVVLAEFFHRLFSSSTTYGVGFTIAVGTGVFSIASYFSFKPLRQAQILTLMESIQNQELRDKAKMKYLEERISRLAKRSKANKGSTSS